MLRELSSDVIRPARGHGKTFGFTRTSDLALVIVECAGLKNCGTLARGGQLPSAGPVVYFARLDKHPGEQILKLVQPDSGDVYKSFPAK